MFATCKELKWVWELVDVIYYRNEGGSKVQLTLPWLRRDGPAQTLRDLRQACRVRNTNLLLSRHRATLASRRAVRHEFEGLEHGLDFNKQRQLYLDLVGRQVQGLLPQICAGGIYTQERLARHFQVTKEKRCSNEECRRKGVVDSAPHIFWECPAGEHLRPRRHKRLG